MRVVADTNVLLSALLWTGTPHRLLRLAQAGQITLCMCPAMVEELEGVISRPRFSSRLHELRTSPHELLLSILKIATIFPDPLSIEQAIPDDPDDNLVISCALAANALYLVTGDDHLLQLVSYKDIEIVPPRTFLSKVLPSWEGDQGDS